MLRETTDAWRNAALALTGALWTTAALVAGRREAGGRIVRLGPYVWTVVDRGDESVAGWGKDNRKRQ